MATTTSSKKKTAASRMAKPAAAKKSTRVSTKQPVQKKKTPAAPSTMTKKTAGAAKTPKKPVKSPSKSTAKKTPVKKTAAVKKGEAPARYRCKLCGYIYSPLRGEPHNGIPRGTEFEDLPDDYVCPVCGQQGKGKIGKWGFEEWRPTRYICSVCSYVYDEKRGEPHRGIRPGTKFENLPEDYTCPVCALDPKIKVRFGKVLKQGFEPLYIG